MIVLKNYISRYLTSTEHQYGFDMAIAQYYLFLFVAANQYGVL